MTGNARRHGELQPYSGMLFSLEREGLQRVHDRDGL